MLYFQDKTQCEKNMSFKMQNAKTQYFLGPESPTKISMGMRLGVGVEFSILPCEL
jgi:hypothetical protein